MAKSEVIRTERLLIEPFSDKFLTAKYVSWLNDPEVVKYSQQRYNKHTLESCRMYLGSFNDTPNYFWAINVFNNELSHIGNINAYVDEKNKTADIGILIGEKTAWNKGYATEALRAVCAYLFKINMRKITAGTISLNEPMLKLMKRIGMVEDGRRIKQYLWEDKEVDIIHMAFFNIDKK